jgi:hypothetical protein
MMFEMDRPVGRPLCLLRNKDNYRCLDAQSSKVNEVWGDVSASKKRVVKLVKTRELLLATLHSSRHEPR